jgi:hypothetical protein
LSYNLRRWINGWSALALALLGGYGGVAYLAAHPNVSDAYRAYYIDRTSDLSPFMLETGMNALPALKAGQVYPHDAPEVLLVGWSAPEPRHTWTLGEQAQIILALPPSQTRRAREFTLTLRGTYLTGVQRIIAQIESPGVRDETLDRTYREGEDIVVTFQVPSGAKSIVTLKLELPDAKAPDNGDPRVLGFALKSLKITQADL